MKFDSDAFKENLGITVPLELANLYTREPFSSSMPVELQFDDEGPILEIQFLLRMGDSENYDKEKNRFTFAVNSDGNELLVDLNTKSLEILQRECGEVECIELTLKDLLEAEKFSLRTSRKYPGGS